MSLATDTIYRKKFEKVNTTQIHQHKCSFLQSSNVHSKVTSLL